MRNLWFLFAVGFCLMGFVNRAQHWYDALGWAIVGGLACVGFWGVTTKEAPRSPAPTPRRGRERCYLVIHLDLKASPPVALFVHTYSCSAKDLTMTGSHEARADLYMVEADSFQEALDEMERVQLLYFPWVTPLLTRKR